MKDYKKLKKLFQDDPVMLSQLISEEQTQLLKEIASKKISLDGVETIKGDKGDVGEIGPIGPQGEQGIQGEKGEDSIIPGPRGDKGDRGIDGKDGKDGLKGDKGDKGLDGKNTNPKDVISEIYNLTGEDEKEFSQKVGSKIDISSIRNAQSFMFKGKKVKFEELMHGGGTTITVSATAPSNPQVNDLWYDIS